MRTKDAPSTPNTQEITRFKNLVQGLGILWQELQAGTKYVFFIMSQS